MIVEQKEFVTQDQVTILIPTLNEQEAIGLVIDDLKAEGFFNILVVDGYSDDGTIETVKSKGVFVLEQNGVGKAGAIRTAVERIATPYVLVIDGDCTYKARDIHRLLARGLDYDEVIGARTRGRKHIPLVNRLGNWVISKTFKLLFGKPITDVLSGMYLVRTEKLREMGAITSTSFDVEVEIATGIARDGEITEVPISYGERRGTKKLRKRDAFRILSTLFWMTNYSNPVLLYGALSSLSIIPAFAILFWVLYDKIIFGVWHSGYMLVGIMFFLFATQALAFSMVSLLVKRSEHRLMRELRRNLQPPRNS